MGYYGLSMGIFRKKWDMSKPRKKHGKIDVHLNCDLDLSNNLRKDSEMQQRSYAQLIKFILTQYYKEQKGLTQK